MCRAPAEPSPEPSVLPPEVVAGLENFIADFKKALPALFGKPTGDEFEHFLGSQWSGPPIGSEVFPDVDAMKVGQILDGIKAGNIRAEVRAVAALRKEGERTKADFDAIEHALAGAVERHFDWREAMRKGKR